MAAPSEERLNELLNEAENRTELDNELLHTIQMHLAVARAQIELAQNELRSLPDERAGLLLSKLKETTEQLVPVVESILDTIPGLMTREEEREYMKVLTEEIKQAQLQQVLENYEPDQLN